jgi:hypothetical protein
MSYSPDQNARSGAAEGGEKCGLALGQAPIATNHSELDSWLDRPAREDGKSGKCLGRDSTSSRETLKNFARNLQGALTVRIE